MAHVGQKVTLDLRRALGRFLGFTHRQFRLFALGNV